MVLWLGHRNSNVQAGHPAPCGAEFQRGGVTNPQSVPSSRLASRVPRGGSHWPIDADTGSG